MMLSELSNRLETQIPYSLKVAKGISSANIGWHIAHSLITLNLIFHSLEQSNPMEFKPRFSLWKWLILLTGHMPTKKAKAPKASLPETKFNGSKIDFDLLLLETKTNLYSDKINILPKNSFVNHPFFGHLNKKQALRIAEIHTNHHLQIIEQIKLND
ncbi:MAG: DUF1569 domain-containing protein [Chitinophagales bacterium]|jgi:hypothetical protein|nr:DUF1569 domain-containing protein [Chitinophagales bacterium]